MKTLLSFFLTAPLWAEVQLDPTLHINGVMGATSASSLEEVGGHAHDPNDNFALQGIDLGLNLRVDDWLAGFINTNVFTDSHHELDVELEEAFLRFQELPGGFDLRVGRFMNRLGRQNNKHLHSWDYVNSDLFTSQFLGEEGLTSEGVELTWLAEFDQTFFAISSSYGQAATHEGHDEGHDEDHDEGPADPHDNGSESAYFSDDLITARAFFGYNRSDFHRHRLGLNGAWGDNRYDRDTNLYSLDYTYTWRENGIESGGRELSLGMELAYRDVAWQHPDNAANIGNVSQSTFAAFASYRFAENWTTAVRYEHLQGREAGAELHLGDIEYAFDSKKRDRISLALTRSFDLGGHDSFLRLQYSHDELPGESADSIFLQFGLNFGPGEVR